MPQGLSLSASLPVALAAFIALGSKRISCLFSLAVGALGRLMSRGDELRQLAAQLSVLAAQEDSIAVGLSRVMGPASPGRGAASPVTGSPMVSAAPAAPAASAPAPSPSHEVAASLLRSASLRATSPRTRTRSRSPVPLPKRAPRAPRRSSSVASSLRGSVALAESGLVTGLATKSCPPVPPPQLRLSRVARALHAASTESQPPVGASGPSAPSAQPLRPLVPRSLRPTPMTNGTRSLTHTVSLVPRPPSPSRLSPLELVGVLATSVAAVSAKQPSAPCGGTFSSLPLSLCVPPDQRGHADGFALGPCTLSRVMSFCRPLQSLPAASGFAGLVRRLRRRPWCSFPLDLLADSEKLYVCRSVPLACAREIGLVATLSGEAFTQVRDLLLLDFILLLMGVETAGGVYDEVHCAQHHRPHGVELRRPRRALSTFWESSLADVFSVARRSQRCDWPVFSTFARGPSVAGSSFFASFRSRPIGCVDPS